jgi:hypothetical protein
MTNQNHTITPLQLPSENSIVFSAPPTEEVLRLDKEGFHYRGQFIEDAGEARRLMVEFLRQSIGPALAEQPVVPTDEELWAVGNDDFRANCYPTDAIHYARAVLARWGQS